MFGLLRSAGDVWCCVLELNRWRRRRQDAPLAGYQELCRELAASGPGTFGELDSAGRAVGAAPLLRRLVRRRRTRKAGDASARYPRRKRGLVPVRWYAGTFALDGRALRLPVAKGRPPLRCGWTGTCLPGRAGPVGDPRVRRRAGCTLDVTAEVPVATYPRRRRTGSGPGGGGGPGHHPPLRGRGTGRAGAAGVRAGHPRRVPPAPARRKGRTRAAAAAPKPGQRGSAVAAAPPRRADGRGPPPAAGSARPSTRPPRRSWTWAVEQRAGTLAVGDPRGVLNLDAGRRHNQRTRDWRVGHLIRALRDKAEAAGITVKLVDERGTSSTCPACARRVPKPAGRIFAARTAGTRGHRDLVAAANIAARNGRRHHPCAHQGAGITHRRAGAHLPGVHPARRDPRRRPPSGHAPAGPLAGTGPPRHGNHAARGVARPTARSPQTRRPTGEPTGRCTGRLVLSRPPRRPCRAASRWRCSRPPRWWPGRRRC